MIEPSDDRVEALQRSLLRSVRSQSYAPEIVLVALADLAGAATAAAKFPLEETMKVVRAGFFSALKRPIPMSGEGSA